MIQHNLNYLFLDIKKKIKSAYELNLRINIHDKQRSLYNQYVN